MSGSSPHREGGPAECPDFASAHATIQRVLAPGTRHGPIEDLVRLASILETLPLGASAEAASLTATRDRLAHSIRGYLIPRFEGDHLPLTVVFAGPTGSGKSTLINSLSGLDVSETGPIRPTTKSPAVLASPDHAPAFAEISGVRCALRTGRAPILSRIVLVDTPDIDSTSIEHRRVAELLIDSADVVVFVTSALRYADLVPWEVLRRAASRGAPVITVLNRVTASSSAAVTDFRSRLRAELADTGIIRVPEHLIAPGNHRLPSRIISPLRRRLLREVDEISADRRQVAERVLGTTIDQALDLADEIEASLEDLTFRGEDLVSRMRKAVGELPLETLCDGLQPPEPAAGEPGRSLWRWRHHIGARVWADTGAVIVDRLVALVEADIRGVVADGGISPGAANRAVGELRARTAAAGSRWIGDLEAMSAGIPARHRSLAALCLAVAATTAHPGVGLGLFFEDAGAIAAARRSLVDRLERVYYEAGSVIAESVTPPGEGEHVERLRDAAFALDARSHLADA